MTNRRPATVAPDWVWDQVSNLDYPHASVVLGVPLGWLKKAVPADKVKYSRLGKHVLFTPDDIAENRRRASQPVKDAPLVTVLGKGDADRAKIRAALIAAEGRRAA